MEIDIKDFVLQQKINEIYNMDLSKIGVGEIVESLGLFMPMIDFVQCFKDIDLQNEFLENQEEITKTRFSIIDYIKKKEKFIDKAGFIFLSYLYLAGIRKLDEGNISEIISDRKLKMKIFERYLEKEPTLLIHSDYDKLEVTAYNSRDYISETGKKKRVEEIKKSLERLVEINKEISLENLLFMHVLTDIESIYAKYPEVGIMIRSNTIAKTYFNEEHSNNLEVTKYLTGEKRCDRPFSDFMPSLLEEIYKNAEYIDIDKMLLLSAYRAKVGMDENLEDKVKENERKLLTEVLKKCHKLIKNEKTKISGEIEFAGQKDRVIRYTYKELEKDIEDRIIDGKYYGIAEVKRIKEELLSGKITLSDIYNKKILTLLKLNMVEKKEFMEKSVENAIDLFNNGIITAEQLKENIINRELTAANILEIFEEKVLTKEDIFQTYINGNLSLEESVKIKEILLDKLQPRRLIEAYRKTDYNEEEKKKSERYISLFRELRIKDSSEEERENIGNEIVLELGEEMTEEEITDLYRRNLIPLNTLTEWNGETAVSKMFAQGLLKPTDARELVNSGKIDLNEIKRNILSRKLSDEEKMTLIFSLFDGENEQDIREELLQTLKISEDEKNYRRTEGENKTKRENSSVTKKKSGYIMDPCYKMNLLKKIDKDYIYSLTGDGHMILELPNINSVIIEKMFRRTKNGIEIANDASTYILSIDEYKASNVLQTNKKIDRSKLYEMCKNGKGTRYYHTKNWGDTIKEAFDIQHSNLYTDKDKQEIDEIIEKIKRTRKLKEI